MIIKRRADGSKPPRQAGRPRRAQQAGSPPPEPTAAEDASRDEPPSIPFLRFDSIVGRGGMAVVWRAWHMELNKFVAVKVLGKNVAVTGQDLRQFMVEVKTMSSLNHQGIVRGYGADCADGRYYFIMDYVDGYTFGSLLKRKSRLPQIDALIICESVADAMKYA
ncbi:MAG: protein kinase [Kiritimatiellae bacterium]|nr:protein kinase [Kiritimatiellia bacterium]